MSKIELKGKDFLCILNEASIGISGTYYRYDLHKKVKISDTQVISLNDILRVGMTKTYSRFRYMIPMGLGALSLFIKSLPEIGYSVDVIPDVYSIGFTLWSIPFQDVAWKLSALLCLASIPFYWLSYQNDLEINTMKGRFLLPCKDISKVDILNFQQKFSEFKSQINKK